MKKRITIKDIARESGVSETTISRYLNQKYEYMSADTRKKIEEIIDKLNYRPNNAARTLKSNETKIIGAVIGDIENPFSATIIKGLSDQCEKNGYSLQIAISDESLEKEQRHIERFMDNQVDGMIINTCGGNEEQLLNLKKSKYPIVLLDRGIEQKTTDIVIPTVTSNNYDIGITAMDYLIEAGFKSIGFFVSKLNNSVRKARVKAFEEKRNEIQNASLYVIDSDEKTLLYTMLLDLKKMPEPRVIFAANGLILLKILETMNEFNFEIKKDFYVMGYDELVWTKIIQPDITTIAQKSYQVACTACDIVIAQLKDGVDNEKQNYIELPSEIIVRSSTKIQDI